MKHIQSEPVSVFARHYTRIAYGSSLVEFADGGFDESKIHRDDGGRFAPTDSAGGDHPADSQAGGKRVDLSSVKGIDKNTLFRELGAKDFRSTMPSMDFPKEVEEHLKVWRASLSDSEKSSVMRYTKEGYANLNKALRSDPELKNPDNAGYRAMAADVQKVILSAPLLDRPMNSWRGLSCENRDKQEQIENGLKAALATGEPITMPGFGSATINANTAADWSNKGVSREVVLEIRSRRASLISALSFHPQEHEVLHPSQAKYRVAAIHEGAEFSSNGNGKRRTYILEEIEEHAVPSITPPEKKQRMARADFSALATRYLESQFSAPDTSSGFARLVRRYLS